jgi:hypothetical protein
MSISAEEGETHTSHTDPIVTPCPDLSAGEVKDVRIFAYEKTREDISIRANVGYSQQQQGLSLVQCLPVRDGS